MKGDNLLPWTPLACVSFTMFIMACTATVTDLRQFARTLAPFQHELDPNVISATQELNRISCGLRCTHTVGCVAFLYGSIAPEAMADGCYTDGSMSYSGLKNVTIFGYTCQMWKDNSPHVHWFHDLAGNHCRDPDSSGFLWCYTTDPAQRWDYCDIGECFPDTNCRLIRGPLPVENIDHPGFTFYINE